MRWLVLGATGLLGQALTSHLRARGEEVTGAARAGADLKLDIADHNALRKAVYATNAECVVNAAAITSLESCEQNPEQAYRANAAPLHALAEWATQTKSKLIQVSTDHYYSGDGAKAHREAWPLMLLNQYARSKYLGEVYACGNARALIVRTNITGPRGWIDRPTFAEWAVRAIDNDEPVNLFTDYYTSTIDAESCAEALVELGRRDVCGLVNVAARDTVSKWDFVHKLAAARRRSLKRAQPASVGSLDTPRAESAGLNVSVVERLLGRAMPTADEVCERLNAQIPIAPKVEAAE